MNSRPRYSLAYAILAAIAFVAAASDATAQDGESTATVCYVSVVSVTFKSAGGLATAWTRALLRAECGADITSINWHRDGVSISGDKPLPANLRTREHHYNADISGRALITFSATANAGAVPAGPAAVIFSD